MLKRLWIFTVLFSLALTACAKSECDTQNTASAAENSSAAYLDVGGEWIAEKLEEAEIPVPMPNSLYAIVTDLDENSVTVKLTNLGYELFYFGHSFRVDVFLDKWYTVPPKPDDETNEFIAESLILESRQSCEKSYSFSGYNAFPDGRYRIVTDTFWFEFKAGETISPQNDLLKKAVDISSFGYFDGQSVTLGNLYFSDAEISRFLSIIGENPAAPAPEWSSSLVKAPVIGIKYKNLYGYTNECAWTNGYFITTSGEAYRLELDERSVKNMLFSADGKTVIKDGYIAQLPCKAHLCRNPNGWIEEFLEPVSFEIPAAPENVTAEITEIDGSHLTVQYINNGEKEWLYGEHFRIDVKLNGNWYYVPEIPGEYSFTDIGYRLPAGESAEMEYSFDMFHGLPVGDYRITANDFCLEFVSIDEGNYGYLQ